METFSGEASIRLAIFLAVLVLMLSIESIFPRSRRSAARLERWTTNTVLMVLGAAVSRSLLPLTLVGLAAIVSEKQWGLLAQTDMHIAIEILIAVVLLDLMIYFQHRAFHHIPLLWRLHKIHHADRDVDVSTGFRFHPLEILISALFKMLCVIAIGANPIAVLVFEVLLNGCAMFNHAHICLPRKVERALKLVLVTPSMHQIHHSIEEAETNSNFGFSVSCWDRLLKTYVAKPESGFSALETGLKEYQSASPSNIGWSLLEPFKTGQNRQSFKIPRQ